MFAVVVRRGTTGHRSPSSSSLRRRPEQKPFPPRRPLQALQRHDDDPRTYNETLGNRARAMPSGGAQDGVTSPYVRPFAKPCRHDAVWPRHIRRVEGASRVRRDSGVRGRSVGLLNPVFVGHHVLALSKAWSTCNVMAVCSRSTTRTRSSSSNVLAVGRTHALCVRQRGLRHRSANT